MAMDTEDISIRRSALNRSFTENDAFSTPLSRMPKRFAEGDPVRTFDELNASMRNMFRQLTTQIAATKDEIKSEIDSKVDQFISATNTKFLEIDQKFDVVNVNVTSISEEVKDSTKITDRCMTLVNVLQQEKLANVMEISGHTPFVDGTPIPEMKREVKLLIESFGIQIKDDDILSTAVKAFKVNVRGSMEKKQIIVVVFKNVETKLNVMKAKRTNSNNRGIYFDNRLTALNRSLMGKAKLVARDKKFKFTVPKWQQNLYEEIGNNLQGH
jgi:hypothetical protein